jgi:hypothetical protein
MTKILLVALVSAALGFCAALLVLRSPRAMSTQAGADSGSGPGKGDSGDKDAAAEKAAMTVAPRPPRAVAPPTPVNPWLFAGDAFEGTFLQLTKEHRAWPDAQWRSELDNLRRIGIKIVIVQWSQYDDTDFALADSGKSPVEAIAAAADEKGMDLYVGLSLRKSWGLAENFTKKYMADELDRNTQLADRLYGLLRPRASFRGWYIPHEVSDLDLANDHQAMTRAFFHKLTAHLNAIDNLKPVLASGYTDPNQSELVHFTWFWTLFLNEAGIDILLFQDGAGIARQTKPQDNLAFVDAIVTLGEEFDFNCEVWLVAETFTQTHGRPLDDQSFAADSADAARLREQLAALSKYKKRLVAYSYFDYMRPSAGEAAAHLFEDYRKFTEETASRNAHGPLILPRPAAPFGSQ